MEYKIERKVEIPKKQPIRDTPEYIALSKLKLNESFEFDKSLVTKVRGCIVKEKNRGLGKLFTTRNMRNGKYRVWRIR